MSYLKAGHPKLFGTLAVVFLAPFATLLGLVTLGFVVGVMLIAVCHSAAGGNQAKSKAHNALPAI